MGLLRFMTAGSVDDGKSTLIGRLFHDAGLILDDQMQAISKHGLNLAYFTDGLKEERERGITIDVAYRFFETSKRKFIVADAPGHKEFTRNMVTAVTHSDAVIVLVDASRGVSEQTKRHLFLARWLGVKSVAVLINKMDLVNYSEEIFQKLKTEIQKLGEKVIIPLSALNGENVISKSTHMNWYQGENLFEWLHRVPGKHAEKNTGLRFPVQISTSDGALGTIKAGEIRCGETVFVNDEAIKIEKILHWPHELEMASQGMAIRLVTSKPLKRGDIISDSISNFHRSKKWKIEWCFLVNEISQGIILKHETSEREIINFTLMKQYSLQINDWIKADGSMVANGIYHGDIELSEDLVAQVGDVLAIIDRESLNTIAAGFIKSIN